MEAQRTKGGDQVDGSADSTGTGRVRSVEDFLAHYGVKGMRWGVRGGKSAKEAPSADAAKSKAIRARAKKGKPRVLSNEELQTAINRMNLEQQFKRLTVNEKPAVTRFISSTLMEIGKREVQATIAKKVAKRAVRGGV